MQTRVLSSLVFLLLSVPPILVGQVTLSVNPSSIQVPLQLGAKGSGLILVSVANGQSSNLSISATTQAGGNWLSVNKTSLSVTGPAAGSFNFQADASTLSTGTYNGTVTVSCVNGPTCTPATVSVTAVVGVTLSIIPSSLQFFAVAGSIQPRIDSSPLLLASGSGTVNLTVSTSVASGGDWLSASLSNGTITAGGPPVRVTVTVDPSVLSPKPANFPANYSGQVTISGGGTTSFTVAVTLQIYQGTDILLVSNAANFSLVPGQRLTQTISYIIANEQNLNLILTANPFNGGPAWLSYTPPTSSTATSFSVTADASTLSPGDYYGSIAITGTNDGVPVNTALSVSAVVSSPATIKPDQTSLSFTLNAGGPPGQKSVSLTSSDGSVLTFSTTATTSSGGNWLQVTSNTPTNLTVTATPGTLAPGTYNGNIQVTLANGGSALNIPVSLVLIKAAALSVDTSPIALTAPLGGTCGSKNVSISSSDPSIILPYNIQASVTTPLFGSWLTVSSGSSSTPGSITITCNSIGLNLGNYSGTITISSQGATNSPVTIPVTLNITNAPAISNGGILNNASYNLASPDVAPGAIVAIFGSGLTDGTSCLPPSCNPTFDTNGSLNTTMAGAQVTVNGTPVPIFYASASPGQLGIQIPAELTAISAQVQVSVGGQTSPPMTVVVDPVSPGIFSSTADGKGAGAITHADGSPVSPQNPANPGEAVVIYATGLGQVSPPVPTGMRPTGVSSTVAPVTVAIDGIPVTPEFAGLAGCCVGLNQVNVRIPMNTRSANDIPVVLSITGKQSNSVTIAVR